MVGMIDASIAKANSFYCSRGIVREFNGDTWKFGPIHEVQFDRHIRCSLLAEFLQANMFPHIALDSMVGCRLKLDRPSSAQTSP